MDGHAREEQISMSHLVKMKLLGHINLPRFAAVWWPFAFIKVYVSENDFDKIFYTFLINCCCFSKIKVASKTKTNMFTKAILFKWLLKNFQQHLSDKESLWEIKKV